MLLWIVNVQVCRWLLLLVNDKKFPLSLSHPIFFSLVRFSEAKRIMLLLVCHKNWKFIWYFHRFWCVFVVVAVFFPICVYVYVCCVSSWCLILAKNQAVWKIFFVKVNILFEGEYFWGPVHFISVRSHIWNCRSCSQMILASIRSLTDRMTVHIYVALSILVHGNQKNGNGTEQNPRVQLLNSSVFCIQ